jgi:hypothetical protein
MWEGGAGMRALGFQDSNEPLLWQLNTLGSSLAKTSADDLQFDGTVEVWSVRMTVLGQTAVRRGAEIQHDATRVRILDLVSNDNRLDDIYLEERDTRARVAGAWTSNWSQAGGSERYIDRYFLVHGATKHAQPASTGDLGSIEMSSMVARFVDVRVSWPHDRGEATLVKVRFEPDHIFELPLRVRGVSSQGIEQIP